MESERERRLGLARAGEVGVGVLPMSLRTRRGGVRTVSSGGMRRTFDNSARRELLPV